VKSIFIDVFSSSAQLGCQVLMDALFRHQQPHCHDAQPVARPRRILAK
jgi:hypothetical protein